MLPELNWGVTGAGLVGVVLTWVLPTTLEDALAIVLAGLAGYVALLNLPLRRAEAKAKVERVANNFIQVPLHIPQLEFVYDGIFPGQTTSGSMWAQRKILAGTRFPLILKTLNPEMLEVLFPCMTVPCCSLQYIHYVGLCQALSGYLRAGMALYVPVTICLLWETPSWGSKDGSREPDAVAIFRMWRTS